MTRVLVTGGGGQLGREFALLLTEMYLESHWQDAHIQQPLWDRYHADAWFINGRSYPDTLEPTTGFYGPTGPRPTGIAVGDPNPWPNPQVVAPPRLSHQPLSSLVSCNAGMKVTMPIVERQATSQPLAFIEKRSRTPPRPRDRSRNNAMKLPPNSPRQNRMVQESKGSSRTKNGAVLQAIAAAMTSTTPARC